MPWLAMRTLAKVKSSPMMPRHPEVPNLIIDRPPREPLTLAHVPLAGSAASKMPKERRLPAGWKPALLFTVSGERGVPTETDPIRSAGGEDGGFFEVWQHVPVGIIPVHKDGMPFYANPAALEIFGEDLLERLSTAPLAELYDPRVA